MAVLDDAARSQLASNRPLWTLHETSMERTFAFADFVGSMGFVIQVAMLAEKAFHHPDIDIRWNRVRLVLSTHSEGGLTDQDAALAAAIDKLVD